MTTMCAGRRPFGVRETARDSPTREAGRRIGLAVTRRRSIVIATLLTVAGLEGIFAAPLACQAVHALHQARPMWLVAAVLAQVASFEALARTQHHMLAAGGVVLRRRHLRVMTYIANAFSATLPVGTVLSTGYVFRRLRALGANSASASFTVLASGILSAVSFAVLALCGAVMAGNESAGTLFTAAPVLAVIAVLLIAHRLTRRSDWLVTTADRVLAPVFRLAGRDIGEVRARAAGFLTDVRQVRPTRRDWATGALFASLNWVADMSCLVATCRAVGVSDASISLILTAYLAGIAVSSLPLLPGGVGTVDIAMVFVLVDGHVQAGAAAAGVMLYRLISFALMATIGWVLWAALRHRDGRIVGRQSRRSNKVTVSTSVVPPPGPKPLGRGAGDRLSNKRASITKAPKTIVGNAEAHTA